MLKVTFKATGRLYGMEETSIEEMQGWFEFWPNRYSFEAPFKVEVKEEGYPRFTEVALLYRDGVRISGVMVDELLRMASIVDVKIESVENPLET